MVKKKVMNKTQQAPSARRILGMVMDVIIIDFGPFSSSSSMDISPRRC